MWYPPALEVFPTPPSHVRQPSGLWWDAQFSVLSGLRFGACVGFRCVQPVSSSGDRGAVKTSYWASAGFDLRFGFPAGVWVSSFSVGCSLHEPFCGGCTGLQRLWKCLIYFGAVQGESVVSKGK